MSPRVAQSPGLEPSGARDHTGRFDLAHEPSHGVVALGEVHEDVGLSGSIGFRGDTGGLGWLDGGAGGRKKLKILSY